MQSHNLLPSLVMVVIFSICNLCAQEIKTFEVQSGKQTTLGMANGKVSFFVVVDSNRIVSDSLAVLSSWQRTYPHAGPVVPVVTDANFSMEVMWTDWQAPKKVNNAENPVTFDKTDFQVVSHEFVSAKKGAKELNLFLKGQTNPLSLKLSILLEPQAFYIHRKLTVLDTEIVNHLLQHIAPIDARVRWFRRYDKKGGFGQPIVLSLSSNSGFFGMEYPAADNLLDTTSGRPRVTCTQEIGEAIGKAGVSSDWAVEGITPDADAKLWFMKYVDDIRVAPLKPYTLYNSWYDLRSPEYPKVPPGNVMNAKNIFHIIDLIRKNMIEKHGIDLDAFVLDDGWDVYKSDWVLRTEQFPNGLKPISDELKKTNTTLGMWFGPIGGYSFRSQRVGWMKQHGYEVTGDQMCVGGKNYSALLKKRVTDFTANDGVGYFKWDGIQFSCSEPDHGHPVGIYSRRAIMQKVIEMCNSVRSKNPNEFLNITSGTWLSPWWVQYANQIWMQGEDYGYADVPSLSPRDAAITYRDLSLYDDFKTNDFWFPIQNLMTHGIIKGTLEKLGGEEEPLDKFTNEVVLYLARGVSMWELYISPDILTDGEWTAMAEAINWAKDRFPVLSTTEMIGGDPKKRETYGYAHFKDKRGIIAARNPWIESSSLDVQLSQTEGLSPDADSLVVQKVYPVHWVSPQLYKQGSTINLPLDGYETAIYEVYPISEAKAPLLTGVPFEVLDRTQTQVRYGVATNSNLHYLNPNIFSSMDSNGAANAPEENEPVKLLDKLNVANGAMNTAFTIDTTVRKSTLAILLTPSAGNAQKTLPQLKLTIDGKTDTARFTKSEGSSTWYTIDVSPGNDSVVAEVIARKSGEQWSGHASTWLICQQKKQMVELTFHPVGSWNLTPLPPKPFPTGIVPVNVKLGEADISSIH